MELHQSLTSQNEGAASITADSLPPPFFYDPHFSRSVTILAAMVLFASMALVAWFAATIPPLDRVAVPERALGLMVSRTMDVEDALTQAPQWERFLYDMTLGNDTNQREQAIIWYRELASYSDDPLVDLNLAILEGEDGRFDDITERIALWSANEFPYPLFARLLRAGYVDASLDPASEQALQADLAELLPAGWFYDRLATRFAQRAENHALLTSVETTSAARADALLWRSRWFAVAELSFMLVGGLVLIAWRTRSPRFGDWLRFGPATLPPRWAGGIGVAVLLRGGAIGALLTVAFLFAAIDFSSLRVVAVPLTNLPLLFLAYRHLLKPQRLGFREGFGLHLASRDVTRLVVAVSAVMAAGLLGEWVLGQVVEPLKLSSHWTEWFDGDLVWASPSVTIVSLLEYVVFAPVFEEIAFRGILFGILRRRYSWAPSAAISAGMFAIAHGYGLVGFLSVFWSGVIWAWAYEKTGSLFPGMVAHALNNLLVCLSVIALLRL
ncbi:MAG: lysostaphin resistance A-like protein [Nitrospiraceae bacterium]